VAPRDALHSGDYNDRLVAPIPGDQGEFPMLALTCALLLPTIWIVDSQMGQGAHFADLPAAIAAAANGDTLVLRAGTYTGAIVNGKQLTLRGEGAAVTRIVGTFGGTGLVISNTAGPVLVSGLRIQGGTGVNVLSAQVELLDCEIFGSGASPGPSPNRSGMIVGTGSTARASRCAFYGGSADLSASPIALPLPTNAVLLFGGTTAVSTFLADECLLRGGDAVVPGSSLNGAAALVSFGRVRLDRCRCRGGNGSTNGGEGVVVPQGGWVRIAGDATAYVTGGLGADGVAPSIRNLASTVFLHLPVATQGPIVGLVQVRQELPRLQVVGVTRADGSFEASQPVVVTLDGQLPNYLGFVAFGPPAWTPVQIPFSTELMLDEWNSFFLFAPLDAAGRLQFTYTPAAIGPALVGVPVHMQGGAFLPPVFWASTSNLAVHVARP
jgi:hypothetical protein